MVGTVIGPGGSYHFVPGVAQYSAGVASRPGFRLHRVAFARPVPLAAGWSAIAAVLARHGRPRTALCATELLSPAPFTEDGFRRFNAAYIDVLDEWDIIKEGINPVARSNTCPLLDPPAEPAFRAFTLTLPDPAAAPSFVVAGSGEAPEGRGTYHDHIVARGDTSATGLHAKAEWVLGEMERRLAALDAAWSGVTATQVYCVHDIHAVLASQIAPRGAARHGLVWNLHRPPVEGLEFEMDCRGLATEETLRD